MRLDYFISSNHPAPQLWDGHKLVTKKVFIACKKKAPHLLRYFTIHHDEAGNQEIRATLPPAFEGFILQQFTQLLTGEA